MPYFAAIDIGTHSALLLIARGRGGVIQPQVDLARTTKLGVDLVNTKLISPVALARLMAVLGTYQAILSEYPIEHLIVFGTAAFRLAENASECRQAIAETFGWSLRILSGEEEADYTFKGVTQLLVRDPPPTHEGAVILAIDIGGGSTEIISGIPEQIQSRWSIPVGAVLLKQQFQPGDTLSASEVEQMKVFLANHFQRVSLSTRPQQILVTGGTATTVAALLQDMEEYDFRRIDGYCCTIDDLDMLFQELNGLTNSQRADLPGMEPGRADVILPALVILHTLLDHIQGNSITITIRGARYGILAQ